jgi:hypothetical protein
MNYNGNKANDNLIHLLKYLTTAPILWKVRILQYVLTPQIQ